MPAEAARGQVDETVHHRRGAVDGGRHLPHPVGVPRRRVEGVELAVVGADVELLAPHGRRRVDVRADVARPEQVARAGAEGVDRPVRVRREHPAVRHGRGGVEVLATGAEAGERARLPPHRARAGPKRRQRTAVVTDVDGAVCVRRRAVDLAVGLRRPDELAGVEVQRIHLVIPRAEVHEPADDERRRLRRDREAPDGTAVGFPHRDHEPGNAARPPRARGGDECLDHESVRDRRGRGRAVRELPPPAPFTCLRIHREEDALQLADEHLAVADRRGELDVPAGPQGPEPTVRRPMPERRQVRALLVVAVRRPRDGSHDALRGVSASRADRVARTPRWRSHAPPSSPSARDTTSPLLPQ